MIQITVICLHNDLAQGFVVVIQNWQTQIPRVTSNG